MRFVCALSQTAGGTRQDCTSFQRELYVLILKFTYFPHSLKLLLLYSFKRLALALILKLKHISQLVKLYFAAVVFANFAFAHRSLPLAFNCTRPMATAAQTLSSLSPQDRAKQAAAYRAVDEYIRDGAVVGVGRCV